MAKNETDPYVFHDPVIKVGQIATIYEPEDSHLVRDDNTIGGNEDREHEKVVGILYPVILVNNKVIDHKQIIKFVLYYSGFTPSIILTIHDPNGTIQATDVPGLNSRIRIAIVPSVKNTYKTIKLEFQIDDFVINEDEVTYTGTYRLHSFTKEYTKELIYSGCINTGGKKGANNQKMEETYSCNPNENKKPNTWEVMHIIAHECGLGFMSTDECQTINDRMPRLMSNEKYPEFIERHIQWAGIDENSIFDCWVDLYGYLVLVNVPWVLYKDVDIDNLKIFCASGIQSTEHNIPKQQTIEVNRVLTNYEFMMQPNNMMFSYYHTIVDNSDLTYGTAMSQYQFNMKGTQEGNVNAVSQYDVRVIQNSADGRDVAAYNTQKSKNTVIEFNELNLNKQKTIRSKFFSKHRQRKLEILLTRPNLGLQRGTLVSVIIFEKNAATISQVADQYKNADGPDDSTEANSIQTDDINEREFKTFASAPVPNVALSGLYYIDEMRFEYEIETDDLKQFIILIKKGSLTNIDNFSTLFRTKDESMQQLQKDLKLDERSRELDKQTLTDLKNIPVEQRI